ncbi:hypothetical protein QKC54_gp0955 [Megavirus baoshan]|uniref:Uncharacterized protein n=1 Tax=Megavirus baoshan TaxID=2496520 RepID=A0A8K1T0U7_9VIRU|nr:hypothetical protein QKC54_gp0955 [Megavirus baoshan]UFX99737.1 hypothetical protein Mb0117 [Megavirus baoshan]
MTSVQKPIPAPKIPPLTTAMVPLVGTIQPILMSAPISRAIR